MIEYEKQKMPPGQSSMVTRAQKPNQLIMAPRGREQTENKGSDDPGSNKSPCLPWGKAYLLTIELYRN